jgi:hypothetical protein
VALAAAAMPLRYRRVAVVNSVLGVEVPPRERVEENPRADTDGQVDGVVPPAREQPGPLQRVERVVEARQGDPALAAHVGGRDHRAGDVAGEEEEEGDVADGEVHPGAEEVAGQRQLRGAAEHTPAGEHHERGDGGAGPALAEDRPQDVGRLHHDEDLHVERSGSSGHVAVSRVCRILSGNPSGRHANATRIGGVHAFLSGNGITVKKNWTVVALGSVVAPRR